MAEPVGEADENGHGISGLSCPPKSLMIWETRIGKVPLPACSSAMAGFQSVE